MVTEVTKTKMNAPKRGFANRLGIVVGLTLAGLVLSAVAKGLMGGIETMADMNVFS